VSDVDMGIGVMAQAVIDMSRAYEALSTGMEMLLAGMEQREMTLIAYAQAYPHADPHEIIAAVERHQQRERGKAQ
jgi:hypothetical protein